MTAGARSLLLDGLQRREAALPDLHGLETEMASVRAILGRDVHGGFNASPACLLCAALVVCTARLGTAATDRICALAAAAEMIWRAILAQRCEVIGGSTPDIIQILGNDLVLARALHVYTSDGDLEVMAAIANGAAVLCEGLAGELQPDLDVDAADARIAEYLAACARVGAAAGGLEPGQTAALARFAWELGFAFAGRGPAPVPHGDWLDRSPELGILARAAAEARRGG